MKVIWSEDRGGWLRPSGLTATMSLREAGRFDAELAEQIARERNALDIFNTIIFDDPFDRRILVRVPEKDA